MGAPQPQPCRDLDDWVRELVDEAPPLSPEQRDRLAVLLRGGGDGNAP
jgi:hypothetical protein